MRVERAARYHASQLETVREHAIMRRPTTRSGISVTCTHVCRECARVSVYLLYVNGRGARHQRKPIQMRSPTDEGADLFDLPAR